MSIRRFLFLTSTFALLTSHPLSSAATYTNKGLGLLVCLDGNFYEPLGDEFLNNYTVVPVVRKAEGFPNFVRVKKLKEELVALKKIMVLEKRGEGQQSSFPPFCLTRNGRGIPFYSQIEINQASDALTLIISSLSRISEFNILPGPFPFYREEEVANLYGILKYFQKVADEYDYKVMPTPFLNKFLKLLEKDKKVLSSSLVSSSFLEKDFELISQKLINLKNLQNNLLERITLMNSKFLTLNEEEHQTILSLVRSLVLGFGFLERNLQYSRKG
ncbi:MAG: hypothetical protein LBI95_01360 [Holosporales bacterium]|nr:hypothetical protein [Holosporales bacterium]